MPYSGFLVPYEEFLEQNSGFLVPCERVLDLYWGLVLPWGVPGAKFGAHMRGFCNLIKGSWSPMTILGGPGAMSRVYVAI